MPRPRLHIDFETFGVLDLTAVGEENYSASAFPLLMGLKADAEPTRVFDYAGIFNEGMDDFGKFDLDFRPDCPSVLAEALKDEWWIVAHNASFESAILRNVPALRHWPRLNVERLICTAAKSRYYGLPGRLEKVGAALELETQKDKEGKRLINKFCKPQKAGRAKGAATYIPHIDTTQEDWHKFRDYNRDDVETEYGVDMALPDMPERFARIYYLDMRMNLRGFPVDMRAVNGAVKFYDYFMGKLRHRFKELTGLAPTQVAEVRKFVNERYGLGLPDLQAATIRDALLEDDLPAVAREILEIRQEASKSSVSKLQAFLDRTGADGRARGGFLFYGAHTGRWSGKGIQPQNFPRGVKWAMKLLRAFYTWLEAVDGDPTPADLAAAELVFPAPLVVLSSALRGFIRATQGDRLLVVDYAQIELRVLAWLAGENELLDALRAGLDPYIQFAAKYMYDVDPATIGKDDIRRQIAKSALLGAQYQIWIDAFIEYCKTTANLKISREDATNAILSYRSAHPHIVQFWKDIEKAAIFTVETRSSAVLNNLRLKFEVINGREWLRIYLPSGRPISYFNPTVKMRITEEVRKDFDGNPKLDENGEPETYTKRKKVLSYMTEYQGRWTKEYTYGGKLTENVTQGIAADIMGEGMDVAESEGYEPIMTVHDENVIAAPEGFGSVEELEDLVCRLSSCYAGLPLAAEGFECYRYRKG